MLLWKMLNTLLLQNMEIVSGRVYSHTNCAMLTNGKAFMSIHVHTLMHNALDHLLPIIMYSLIKACFKPQCIATRSQVIYEYPGEDLQLCRFVEWSEEAHRGL